MHYTGPERRDNTVDQRLTALEVSVADVREGLYRVRLGQDKNNEQTAEMYEVILAAKGVIKTLQLAGRVAKPLLWIGALASAIVVGIKTGVWNFKT